MDWLLSCLTGRKPSKLIGDIVNTHRKGTLTSLFWDQMKKNVINPNATAIIQPNCYENSSTEFDFRGYGEDGFKGYTYTQLQETVHRLAHAMKKQIRSLGRSLRNGDGDPVIAFCIPSTFRMVATVLAILELRCCYLAIDAMCAEEQLIHIMMDIEPLLIIIEPHGPIVSRYNFMNSTKTPPVISIDTLWEAAMRFSPGSFADISPLFEQKPEDVVTTICYTSGTTALPKPVRISHPTMFNRLVWQWKTFPYQSEDIAGLISRPTSIGFIPELFAPLLVGIPVFILHRFSKPKAGALIGAIQRSKLTHLTVSPVLLNSIVEMVEQAANPNTIRFKLASVKIWACRGEIMSFDLAERFFRTLGHRRMTDPKSIGKGGSPPPPRVSKSQGDMLQREVDTKVILLHLYGSTEVSSDVLYEVFKNTSDLISKSKDYRVPLGRPIFNTNVCILDEDAPDIVPMKTTGEICIAGLSVSLGYISKLDETMGDFVEKVFPRGLQYREGRRTNDLGTIEICNDGIPRVFIDSRCPVVAKAHGKTVRVDKIAKVIRDTGMVDRLEMFIYSPGRFNQTIVAAVELKSGYAAIDVRKVLNQKMQTDVPAEVFHLKEIPTMADGKTDHRMLLQKYRKYRLVTQGRVRNAIKLPVNKSEITKTTTKFIPFKGHVTGS